MPIYEYICSDCKKEFEFMHLSSGAEQVLCPSCSSKKVEKQFSTFSAHGGSVPDFAPPTGGCPNMMGGGCPSGGCSMA